MPEVKTYHSARVRVLHLLLLALLIAVAYLRVSDNGFIRAFDDGTYVLSNPHVSSGLTIDGIRWAFTASYASNWHPLTWISHMLDWQLYGSNGAGHHLTNLLFHMANTMLVFALLCWMTGHRRRSLFVAALFAIHPLHVESVAWIAERKDVLSTFFGLLTIAAYLHYVRRPQARRYMLVVLAFVLSLLSKPMMVSLPFMLLLLDYWPLRREVSARKLILEKIPLMALVAASCLVTLWAQHAGGSMISVARMPFGVRAANAAVSCAGYIAKMFWPQNLAVFYPHPLATLPVWQVIGSVLFTAAGFAAAVACVKKRPYVTVGWLWYVITLVPVVGLVQVGVQAMADRYTYVPLLGIFIALTWLAADTYERLTSARETPWKRVLPAVVATAIVLTLAARTFVEVGYWRNSETLFTRAIEVTPKNLLAHYNLALEVQKLGRFSEAAEHYRAVLQIDPNNVDATKNLGLSLLREQSYDEASDVFRTLLKLRPGSAKAYQGLAMALEGQGRRAESIAYYRKVVEVEPSSSLGHYNLGNVLSRSGKIDEAANEYHEAIRLDPHSAAAHHNLGVVFQRKHRLDLALKEYREAVRIAPNDPETHNTLGVALFGAGDYAGAWEQVQETLQCGGQPDPDLVEVLQRKMGQR